MIAYVSTSEELSGTVAAESAFVIVTSDTRAVDDLKAKADIFSGAVNFSGDDAFTLMLDDTVVDSFGQIGTRPDNGQWSAGGVATKDKTLRRKADVTSGRTDATSAFDPSEQWLQFDKDDFSGLGFHGENNQPEPEPEPVTPLECGAAKTLINAIQGEGGDSPLLNTEVELEGVVTADFQGAEQLSGFFITSLDADIDTNPLTSEGVFVYFADTDVNVGDHVRVKGSVAEYFNATQIGDVSQVEI